ncbi:epidermal growth factor receptor kinase substrate 8 isoform X1 [Anastrepha ludens]|uniref:epidermal growth factor receptor kinase substrate 8 isoform X1 n=1 Tax=Anastrepha ludens TaxID=28586 RepID=UPI0023B01945|nr:epidermal growth factor receptor kinase substrate 8 isoform X1 [Anastrepha ludens]XP_053970056.1 epidermal growth factor receptor kinase substrate 8 isoform X1 [Anastrepha ludens]
MMVSTNIDQKRDPSSNVTNGDTKPTYALEHLATFKVQHESDVRKPKEKLNVLKDLDISGAIWPQKMYMSFSGQWLVILDSEMKEIENFPGSLIKEPMAFISEDPLEIFNNILVFTVPGVSLGTTEMHFFQATNVSAIHMVEDLKQLSSGKVVTIDRNLTPIQVPKPEKTPQNARDQYGIAIAAAEVAAEKNALDAEQNLRDTQVLNHCFEDIERFVARLKYAAEALLELELRHEEHNPHGEGLLILRSRPPIESEFLDIIAKLKLALNFVVKLNNHFSNGTEPISDLFISLHTIVNVCNDVHVGAKIPENVVNPLLRRETIQFLSNCLNVADIDFWRSLGKNWTMAKEHFKDHRGSYHPIFYDDWSPDWVVDDEVSYIPLPKPDSPITPRILASNAVWLSRLQSRNVKIAEVVYNNKANNDRELNVVKGEYLEVINDSRNWWKVRNSAGNVGYVPHTVLKAHNFEVQPNYSTKDTDSVTSSILDHETANLNQNNNQFVDATERETVQSKNAGKSMPRSYSMPNVPVPPPMPPTEDSEPPTPSGTLKRNTASAGSLAAMRAREENETNDELLMLQGTINEELKATLYQRERRRDLEILTTPNVHINQYSSPQEVKEWLHAKGFPAVIINKLCKLNGEELFALSPHVIEGYFGQKESRRLISQIVLQKNICEYKTIRSSELSAKLAKARQKADQQDNDLNEIF